MNYRKNLNTTSRPKRILRTMSEANINNHQMTHLCLGILRLMSTVNQLDNKTAISSAVSKKKLFYNDALIVFFIFFFFLI